MDDLTLSINAVVDIEEDDLESFMADFDELLKKYVVDTHTAYVAQISSLSMAEIQQIEAD